MMWWFTRWNHSLLRICLRAGLHGIDAMFLEPFVDIEAEVLLAPQHPGQGLAHDARLVFGYPLRRDGSVELVRLVPARFDGLPRRS